MVSQRDDQILFFLPLTCNMIDHLQYASDKDIDEFQGVIEQLPDDFSDNCREFAFYFID